MGGRSSTTGALAAIMLLVAGSAVAKEYPIGKPQYGGGLEVIAVYLKPVKMEAGGTMRPYTDSDIHLEADIHALGNNPNGLGEGEWAPFLSLTYTLRKIGGDGGTVTGAMLPMIAADGPHYGNNVKLMGKGKYILTFQITPPAGVGSAKFARHTDAETGVAGWFKPFKVDFTFNFDGFTDNSAD